MFNVLAVAAFALTTATPCVSQGLVGDALAKDLKDNAASFWIYDDLKAAEATAKKTGKPLLISFRCVP